MKLRMKTFRDAGLEARWGKTRAGAPVVSVRDPNGEMRHQRETWWMVDRDMWAAMNKQGVREGFTAATSLGDIFSI